MLQQPGDYTQRASSYIRADLCALDEVDGVADRRSKDLGIEAIVVVNLPDLVDQLNAVVRNVVESAEKRRYITCTGFSRKQCLSRGKDQRAVRANTFAGEFFDGLHTVADHGNLHDDLVIYLGKLPSFLYDVVEVGGNNLGTNVVVDDIANGFVVLTDVGLTADALFRHERRVSSNAIQHAEIVSFLDFFEIRGVNEKLHILLTVSAQITVGAQI